MIDDESETTEAPNDYSFQTYNLRVYLLVNRRDDIRHQKMVADFLGVHVSDLNYDQDYILVGTFVPDVPVEEEV